VLKGVTRGRFEIAPGWELTVLRWFHGLAAPAIHWYLDRLTARQD
jgi:hypothetical protein